MVEIFKEALNKQNELNNSINSNWIVVKNPQHRAMWTEAAEMAESFYWYWWKDVNKEPDVENIKVEVIDIFHFLLSDYIQTFKNIEDIASYFNSRLHHLAKFQDEYKSLVKERALSKAKEKEIILTVIDEFVSQAANKKSGPVSAILFYKLMAYSEITLEELFKKYFGKCTLNKFRQDKNYKKAKYNMSNYKEDGYLKEWKENTEDNVFMLSIIEKLNIDTDINIFMEKLYKELNSIYEEAISQLPKNPF